MVEYGLRLSFSLSLSFVDVNNRSKIPRYHIRAKEKNILILFELVRLEMNASFRLYSFFFAV